MTGTIIRSILAPYPHSFGGLPLRFRLLTLLLLMSTSGVSALGIEKTKLRTIFVEMQPVLLINDVDTTGTGTREKFTTWHCTLRTGYVFKKSGTDLFYCGLSLTPPQFNVNEEFAYSGISLLVGRLIQIQYDVLYFRTQLGIGACRTSLPGIVRYDGFISEDFGLRLTLGDN